MKTRDQAIRDLADHAKDQCEALADKMTSVIDGMDENGDPEDERLCGISHDRDRAILVFAEPDTTGQRTVVYVDAILALAKLLNGEVQVSTQDQTT